GVFLDHDILVERATTGEDIPIRIRSRNLNMDILDGLTFSYGNETAGFTQQVLDHDVEEQIVYLPVPENSLDIIYFNINSSDKLGKNRSVGPVPVEVFDNDAPVIDVLSSSLSINAGENISVIISVSDNIEVDDVWSVLSGAVEGEFPLVHSGGLWYLDIVTDAGVLGNVSITIHATDTSGNHADLVIDEVSLVDGTPPSILADLTPNSVSTGDEMIFSVVCSDANGISFVRVEYRQGEASDIIYLDHIFNSPSSPESLPGSFDPSEYTGEWSCYSGSFIVPIDDVSDIVYRFVIEDTKGNMQVGPWTTVNVIDDILPVVVVDWGSSEPWNGEEFDIVFTATDNIGVVERWLSVCHSDNVLLNETGEGIIIFSVPVDLSGSITIRAFGRDASDNLFLYVSDPIPVNDGILPTCGISGFLKGETGQVVRLELVPEDNIGISSVSWSVGGISGTGNLVEFDTDEEGEYRLDVEVQDLSGNKGSFNWTIIMEDPHDVDGNRTSSIVIILIVIIAAIFVMVVIIVMFIISRRKRKPVDNGEDPSGSDYGSIEE
ncbi:MAG: hypothetical protein JW939_09255, partial [Candidatus Thermoplasmatota archaeon]|nr:hypothetical protein [Candidatus Thermoplasmatota archaeon]